MPLALIWESTILIRCFTYLSIAYPEDAFLGDLRHLVHFCRMQPWLPFANQVIVPQLLLLSADYLMDFKMIHLVHPASTTRIAVAVLRLTPFDNLLEIC